jgi:hypothetical protein
MFIKACQTHCSGYGVIGAVLFNQCFSLCLLKLSLSGLWSSCRRVQHQKCFSCCSQILRCPKCLFCLFKYLLKCKCILSANHIYSAGVGLYLRSCKRVVITLGDPELTFSPDDLSMCFCDSCVLCRVV